jgi:hypothetical protein
MLNGRSPASGLQDCLFRSLLLIISSEEGKMMKKVSVNVNLHNQ